MVLIDSAIANTRTDHDTKTCTDTKMITKAQCNAYTSALDAWRKALEDVQESKSW